MTRPGKPVLTPEQRASADRAIRKAHLIAWTIRADKEQKS